MRTTAASTGNWVADSLQHALELWNEKLGEVWQLVTESPQTFRGGGIWETIVSINGGIRAVGYGLIVLFFAMSIFASTANFRDLKRWEYSLRHFIRFVAAKTAVTYGMDILLALFGICSGIVSSAMNTAGGMTVQGLSLPESIVTAINGVNFFASVPLWILSLLGSLGVTVVSYMMLMSVYGRIFKLYLYTAISPLPLSAFAGEPSAGVGKTFIKSYIGVCLEGVVILVSCLIYSAFMANPPEVKGDSAFMMVFSYMGDCMFNMLILVGLVKGCDHLVKEMLGL